MSLIYIDKIEWNISLKYDQFWYLVNVFLYHWGAFWYGKFITAIRFLYDIDFCNMEKEKHVVEGSTQKNLALDPEKQKEFKKNNKEIKSKVVFVIYG